MSAREGPARGPADDVSRAKGSSQSGSWAARGGSRRRVRGSPGRRRGGTSRADGPQDHATEDSSTACISTLSSEQMEALRNTMQSLIENGIQRGIGKARMTLSDVSHQIPAAYAMVDRLVHYRRRARRQQLIARVGYLGIGLAVGSGLAVLLAPRSGAETRQKLRERLDDARQYVTAQSAGAASARPHNGMAGRHEPRAAL